MRKMLSDAVCANFAEQLPKQRHMARSRSLADQDQGARR